MPCLFAMYEPDKPNEPYELHILGDGQKSEVKEVIIKLWRQDLSNKAPSTISFVSPDWDGIFYPNIQKSYFLFYVVDASKFIDLHESTLRLLRETSKYCFDQRRDGKVQILFTGLGDFDPHLKESLKEKFRGEDLRIFDNHFSFLPLGFDENTLDIERLYRSLWNWANR